MTRDPQTTEPAPRGYTPEGLEDAFSAADPAPGATGRGAGQAPTLPSLGLVGWLRWAWRQLTSMRVALLLLMLLAVAAVPGTIFPQRSQDPAEVATYLSDHPDLGPVLDRLGFFGVYSSVWFSAIYLLLFISLVGCVLPRTKHHWKALRTRPPRTPARLARLDAYQQSRIDVADGDDAASVAAMHSEKAVFDDGRLGDHAALLAELAWRRLAR